MRQLNCDEEVAKAASSLKANSPVGFEALVSAIERMTEEAQDRCINSSADALRLNQGHAQCMLRIRRVFANCDEITKKLTR